MTKNTTFQFNSLQDVLNLLPNTEIYTGQGEALGNTTSATIQVYAIGWTNSDTVITPWRVTKEELLDWCQSAEGQEHLDSVGRFVFDDWDENREVEEVEL